MDTSDIIRIIRETCFHLKLHLNEGELQSVYFNQRKYEVEDILEFKRDLIEAGRKCNLFGEKGFFKFCGNNTLESRFIYISYARVE